MASKLDRFWSKVDRSGGPDACWEWHAAMLTAGGGYGVFQVGTAARPRSILAHRQAWLLAYGPDSIPEGMCVLHRCDNPPCVRLSHLFLGTIADNNRDMAAKGRHGRPNAKKQSCPARHPYSGLNLIITASGTRQCRECNRVRSRAWRAWRKAA